MPKGRPGGKRISKARPKTFRVNYWKCPKCGRDDNYFRMGPYYVCLSCQNPPTEKEKEYLNKALKRREKRVKKN